MQDFGRKKRRLPFAAGALCLALAMVFGAQSAFAQGAAAENDDGWDVRTMRRFLKDLGLQRDGGVIEYRERSPLVVPPSRELPRPEAAGPAANNPAWPKDPEVMQARREAAKPKRRYSTAHEAEIEEARPLRPNELEVGRAAAADITGSVPQTPEESARPLAPSKLGTKSIFSWFSRSKTADAMPQFVEEPPRENLTAPPPGYQTPSADQPYGYNAKRDYKPKPRTLEDRAIGN